MYLGCFYIYLFVYLFIYLFVSLFIYYTFFADSKNVEVSLANVFSLEGEKGGGGEQEKEEMEVSLEETTDAAQGINDSKKTLIRR